MESQRRRTSTGSRGISDISDGFRADTGFVPAGRLPRGVRQDRLDVPADQFPLAASHLRERGPPARYVRRADQPQPSAGRRHGHEAERLHAVSATSTIQIRTPAGVLIGRRQLQYYVQFSPSGFFAQIQSDGNARRGHRLRELAARPTARRSISARHCGRPITSSSRSLANQQWLNVDDAAGVSRTALHGARVTRQRHLHVHVAPVRAGHRAIRVDRSRSLALLPTRDGAVGHLRRLRCCWRTS